MPWHRPIRGNTTFSHTHTQDTHHPLVISRFFWVRSFFCISVDVKQTYVFATKQRILVDQISNSQSFLFSNFSNKIIFLLVLYKGIMSVPQTLNFKSLYLCNPMQKIFDISNYEFFLILQFRFKISKGQMDTLSGCKDVGIGKFYFVARTQFLYNYKYLKIFFYS